MELKKIGNKLLEVFKKHKYPILVLLIGVLLMLWPSTNNPDTPDISITETRQTQTDTLEHRLSTLLSKVSGAGEVSVILTEASGYETIYQEDSEISENGETGSYKNETVIITDEARSQAGLVRQINPPKYQGAIILCQGADRSSVRLSLVEAVSKATGLGADRIVVLKMK